MKAIPLFKCRDIKIAIAFYTGVLDFELKYPDDLGPTDQTWGTREFYVTDADGNTLRFCQPIE